MRKGFTFIELVLAIVVMSIALMSVPLILSQTSKSDQFNLNQEVLLASFTKMQNILSYPWDENLTGNEETKLVLDVTNGNTNLNRYPNNSSTRRIGHFEGNYRRKFYSTYPTPASAIGQDANDAGTYDDMDDFNDTNDSITGGGGEDYVKTFTLYTTVKYVSLGSYSNTDPNPTLTLNLTSTSGTTNIKMVTIEAKEQNKTISVLNSFATNIGSYQLLYRTY